MKLFILFALIATKVFAWGNEGHEVVGALAERFLRPEAKTKIYRISGGESLADLSTWPDKIKTSPEWSHSKPWHYVTIPDGMTYNDIVKDPEGDVVDAIRHFTNDLKDESLPLEKRRWALAFIVHFIGDIHQPLHVGKPGDLGGNTIKLNWRGEYTNLHSVWDQSIVRSITPNVNDYVANLSAIKFEEVRAIGRDDILVWTQEAMLLRPLVYNIPDTSRMGWEDQYEHAVREVIKSRLQKAGSRLAMWLNNTL